MKNLRNYSTALGFAFVAVCLATLTGCGDVAGRIDVKGKVTYQGGDWPKSGTIYFNPVEPAPGYPRLNGIGTFEPDGMFVVQAAGDATGLVPGKYAVNIECWEVVPTMQSPEGKSYLPKDFKFPEVVIEEGESSKEITLDVPAA